MLSSARCVLLYGRHLLAVRRCFLRPAIRVHKRRWNCRVPIRTWEFLPVVGTRAGLFGNESGRFEAWVYPLKIFRDFHLTFHVGDRALPAESLARTLTVTPESASILYAGDSFRVRETLCVPVNEPGAVILLESRPRNP